MTKRWMEQILDQHDNDDTGDGKTIAQHGQGVQLFGDVAGHAKPTCYIQKISD
jgi:hypothetical protein